MRQIEHNIQVSIITYLRYAHPSAIFCASAGGMFTTPKQGKKMVAAGYVKGYPDLAIHEPRGGYHGLFIELKSDTGKTSPEQRDWIAKLMERGYYAQICKGTDQAINLIDAYLSGKVTR
jgi:hypothetical protein